MRKSLIILSGILVCALNALGNVSQPNTTTLESHRTTLPARLSPAEITLRLTEARQLLQSSLSVSSDSVGVALLDSERGKLSIVSLPKTDFLTKDTVLSANTSLGSKVRVEIVRANGVNTALVVTDTNSGQPLVPLVVQFPIVKNGGISEVAYYSSAHPALLSAELSNAGQSYIRTKLDLAAARLAGNGIPIPADIVNVAEHLCIVEHTDHKRFMNEKQSELFPEILSLYALNQGGTYRYSVSTAGAGGMIQMIPRTYEAIRQQHSSVTLNPDFVSGMRDHSNALEAMLLYMNDTWNDLARRPEVQAALDSGIAHKAELLAAGYNSNPARLPGYLTEGGDEWRTRIPAETQMYLRIYSSVDENVSFNAPKTVATDVSSAVDGFATGSLPIFFWLPQSLLRTSGFPLFP
jgi:hypothetical protein